jgi:hypothetical protein
MNEIALIENQLRENIGKLLIELQTAKTINKLAFDSIVQLSNEIACALKSSELISKSLLNELRSLIKVLRAEAPFFQEKSVLLENMADQMDMIFDLILRGETHEDRQPGVPRII